MQHSTKLAMWIRRAVRLCALAGLACVVVVVGYKVVFGANGTVEWRAKRAEYQRLQNEIEKANQQHQELESRVRKLQSDPNTIIKEARERLGYVRPGEVILVQPQRQTEVRSASVAQNVPESVSTTQRER